MSRRPEIGNIQLYPERPLRESDKNGYVLKFYCPIRNTRIRKNCGTRDRREARRIMRECRDRLLNGKYIESDGAITDAYEQLVPRPTVPAGTAKDALGMTWQECFEHFYHHRKQRVRPKSLLDAASRIQIAERVLEGYRDDRGLSNTATAEDYMTLEAMEYLQDRLLAGDESRFDSRSPMTVNTMIGAVMTFVRYCHKHGWIEKVPPLEKLSVDDVMKGRPITSDEFDCMLHVVPQVVGERPAESWKLVLNVLWESAFRIGDVMNFSWDDERRIHPVWPQRKAHFPTLVIPSIQKNKKAQEIPMLPGLQTLLEQVPSRERRGWVVNPLPMEFQIRAEAEWFQPTAADLNKLVNEHNNSAIARACGVSETTVRKWMKKAGILRSLEFDRHHGDIGADIIADVRKRAERLLAYPACRTTDRLTKERVGRIISMVGEAARVVVQQPNPETGRRLKYASAHDLRRGCAQRLINAGISAETLKLVLRHKDFSTTERFYGATRAAQAAASEIHERLAVERKKSELVGGLVGGIKEAPQLSAEELQKLKALLAST